MTATMTGRERLLAAIRHEEPDRVPISPRIWAYLVDYYGGNGWEYNLRAAEEFGYDICLPVASPLPAVLYPALAYRALAPDVVVTQNIEEQDGAVTVRRRFETPAGPLSDVVFLAPPPVGDVDLAEAKRAYGA